MRYVDIEGLPRISKVGLGTWQFGAREWGYGQQYAEAEATAIVRRALELGVTLFDTAEAYAFGRSERILGAALGEQRDEVFLATKLFPVAPTPAYVRKHALASRERLGVRRIPLYQVHWPNPVVSDDTVMRGLRGVQDEGVVAEVGVSNYGLDRWQSAERSLGRRLLSNQVSFSLAAPKPLWQQVPWASAHDRVVIAYSPLAQGLLGGRYDEHNRPGGVRATNTLFLPDNLRRAAPLLATMREVAVGHGATVAQVALAWLVHLAPVVVIPGASSVAQLESNVAAADIALREDEHAALTAAAERFNPVTGPQAAVKVLPDLVRNLARR
jgi:aryl-alcohol dehydrogenase-like predicted oxidoreductase